jgi:EpsI family protein
LLGAAYIATASKTEEIPPRQSLREFPLQVGDWRGERLPDLEPEILDVLGVDEYLNRVYESNGAVAGLYIGYYQSQRQNDTIHSPLNCLPGSGWEPLSHDYVPVNVRVGGSGTQTVTINRYVVQKGLDRQVVLYWYHSHGRVVANEYKSKVLMVYDAVRLNRTDAALVRVISPRVGNAADAEEKAGANAIRFVQAMFPFLDQYIPQ